ncbi:hepatocellular carcinoma-associated antigen 59-domain-containing protein [Cokeromyces recurvatus]|uniref:hepatocellular carcinoma-associated antigen 59-domain-containing protein n=1 Tax=Cokeromyces recurvatus TaxID=90255 RepID=UPI0022200D03|nr:hepatocellular carcinoma-associated antigen 59-domain-containing protein [Cokeromyces recurvatus]KAI7906810.1 hepatocellular carcinoma-associated antigen 59-domain-containing protein [Cokeromyces recurvatus]
MAIIKKTKNYRKKNIDSDDEAENLTEPIQEISETLEELAELRKMRRKHTGIDAEKLLKGAEQKKKKRKTETANGWNLKTGGLVDSDAYRAKLDEEGSSATKKLKLDAFASATNTLDVDKHMMEYIENEMRKRRGGKGVNDEDEDGDEDGDKGFVDIYEELYHIPDRLKTEKKEEEGNVQLSTQMLTAIPEVDLGIDTRLKNIEETEKAKRRLIEESQRENETENKLYQDNIPANFEKQSVNKFRPRLDQNLKATDEQAVARFKRRMRK